MWELPCNPPPHPLAATTATHITNLISHTRFENKMDSICVVCGKTGRELQTCKRCRSIQYCSKQCQVYDWKCHKFLCKESPYPPKDPKITSVRAIYFPADSRQPRFVELPYTVEHDEDSGVWHKVHHSAIINKSWFIQYIEVGVNRVATRNLGYNIEIRIKEDGLVDGISKPNICVQAVRGANEWHRYEWHGPLLVLKSKARLGWDPNVLHMDIQMEDMRNFIDYVKLYPLTGSELDARVTEMKNKIVNTKIHLPGMFPQCFIYHTDLLTL